MIKIPKVFRVISMALILTLCIQLVPMDVFAASDKNAYTPENTASVTEQKYVNIFNDTDNSSLEITDDNIITEIADKREENIKYFLLTDGTIAAAVYDNAVHQLDENGKWQDIDNTLSYDGELSSDNESVITENVSDSSLSAVQSFSDSFSTVMKSVSASDINAALSDSKSGTNTALDDSDVFEKSQNKLKISFAKKAKDGKLLSIKTDDYKIDWGLKNISSKVKQASLSEIKPEKGRKKTATKSVSGVLQYNNVINNVDLTYQLVGNDIKENIVLNKSNAAQTFEFTLKCNKLIPELENNRILLKNSKREVVYTIDAPYMVDAFDVYSGEVKLELTADKKGNSYTVKLIPDMEWLNSAERAYPVIIDPTITKTYNKNNVDNTSVTSKRPTSAEMYQYGVMYVGRESSSYEKLRGLFKFTLPTEITESDMIMDAYITLTQRNYFGDGSVVVNAHKMTSDVALSSATWNKVNGKYNTNVLDTQTVSTSTKGNHIKFDITAAVRDWYLSGNNYGLALVSENETGAYKYATFYSARYPNLATANLPALTVTYRNNDGIESYLTYHEVGSDSMGTAYIGDFNGNMIYSFVDVSTDGNYMPLAISHVYNHSQRSNANLTGGDMRFGYGMRLNLSQRIVSAGITGYSYKWTDEDGTVHYFKQSSDDSSLHEEEFDTGRTITVNSDKTFTLNDGSTENYIFSSSGYLTKIEDTSNNKSIVITYSGTKITKVTDGAGRAVTFVYDSSNYLTSITDPANRVTSYTYSSGYLTKITNPDGTSVSYTYAADGSNKILTKITDIDGSAVAFAYNTASPRRVKTVTEYGTAGTQGNKLTYTYNAGETKIADASGQSETMMFDNYGHTVCVRDGQGNAVYGSYNNTSDNKRNTLKYQSNMQSTVTNYLLNHDFEYSALAPWIEYDTSYAATGATTLDSSVKYSGSKSMKVTSTSTTGRIGYMEPLTLTNVAGSTYTFSTYLKVSDLTTTSNTNSGVLISYSYKTSDGTWHLARREFIKNTCDWKRVSYTFTFPEDTVNNYFKVVLGLENATGTVYFDNCQLEEGAVANRYNLLDNGHFSEATGASSIKSWVGAKTNASTDVAVSGRSGSGFKIVGAATYKNFEQTVNVSGGQGDSYVFGAWAKANAIAKKNKNGGSDRNFAIRITFTNSDSTESKYYFDFEAKTPNWQYLSGTVTAPKDYTNVKIALLYNNQRNYAVFDDIQLYQESFGLRYTYDKFGRIETKTDSMNRKITYTYLEDKRPEISKITYSDGTETTYTYENETYRLLTVKDANGKVATYNYDSDGNAVSVSTTADGKTMTSGINEYNGAYVSSTTDSFGNTVAYNYDQTKGLLNSTLNSNGSKTEYTYDSQNDKLLSVSSSDSMAKYEYSNGKLSTVSHNTDQNESNNVAYRFEYDEFGNRKSVKVGSQELINYTRKANNGHLIKTTYGNGNYSEPVYDSLDRVISMKYNGIEKYNWVYGSDGKVGVHNDLVNGVSWRYEYTTNGDVTSAVGSNGEKFAYTYDTANGYLTSSTVTADGVSKKTAYNYSDRTSEKDKNILESITLPSAVIKYNHDGFYRTSSTNLTVSDTDILTTSYGYLNGTVEDSTTSMVSAVANNGNNWNQTLNYTYDASGNIETVSEGDEQKAKYYYDALNQLIREDNAWLGKTIAYTYDNGGNIHLVEEYELTSGSLEGLTATNSYSYLYGDSNWKDKLTSYNGNAITYDQIGNPISYYNGTVFTWQDGRQLAGMTTVSESDITYTYNSNGIRTSKTVNGVTTDYTIEGDKVVRESDGTDTIWYYYDAGNSVTGFELNGTPYYYVKNIQGDIVAIVDASGNKVVEYVYNSWGKLISITGELADTVGEKNPYRYRGYRYDIDTGLYYLNSRYYDPEIGRFINADGYVSTGQGLSGHNMFVYCGNNPINNSDPSGTFWKEIGNWFSDTWKSFKTWASNTFGAGSSVVYQTKKESSPNEWFSDFSVLIIKNGVRTSTTTTKYGDSSKPISVYAKGRSDNWLLSSIGININIYDFTLNVNLGLDNIGISGSINNNDVTNTFGIIADISNFKIGFEYSLTEKWDNNTTITEYTNVSMNGYYILAILFGRASQSSQSQPSLEPLPSYGR